MRIARHSPAPVHVAAPVDPELYYFMANRRFRVQDFLGVEQHKFVAAIYAGLLRREPDPGGTDGRRLRLDIHERTTSCATPAPRSNPTPKPNAFA